MGCPVVVVVVETVERGGAGDRGTVLSMLVAALLMLVEREWWCVGG